MEFVAALPAGDSSSHVSRGLRRPGAPATSFVFQDATKGSVGAARVHGVAWERAARKRY